MRAGSFEASNLLLVTVHNRPQAALLSVIGGPAGR
jgi:hypothetical protein